MGKNLIQMIFIEPGQTWVPMNGSRYMSVRPPRRDLTGVTLADEDTISVPTDDDDRAILGNVAMAPGVNFCANNANGPTWWTNLQTLLE